MPLDNSARGQPSKSAMETDAKVTRGVLWTVGEVHFLTTPLRTFSPLAAISRQFARWLRDYERVFMQDAQPGPWDYYLEGSIRNSDAPIFAHPQAARALGQGQYFIADDDNDHVVERVVRALLLRGVEGITDGA
jgi:hypothetical protein